MGFPTNPPLCRGSTFTKRRIPSSAYSSVTRTMRATAIGQALNRGRAASQGLPALLGGTRLGFLGVLGCCRCGGGADVGVSAMGGGFGGGRPTNPNRSPQTGSSSPLEGNGGGFDGLGIAQFLG